MKTCFSEGKPSNIQYFYESPLYPNFKKEKPPHNFRWMEELCTHDTVTRTNMF